MFGKLMKYEVKYYAKTFIPLCGVFLLFVAVFIPAQFINIGIDVFSEVISYLILMLGIGLSSGFSTVCTVLIVVRFYKQLFSREGYLSFTLPVNNMQHVFSKLLSASVVMSFVSVVSIFVGGLLYFAYLLNMYALETSENIFASMEMLRSIVQELVADITMIANSVSTVYCVYIIGILVQIIFLSIFSVLLSVMYYYFCIVFGQAIWPKHRIVAAIIVFVCGELLSQLMSQLLTFVLPVLVLGYSVLDLPSLFHTADFYFIALNVILLLINVGFLFMSTLLLTTIWYILKYRLNLE